jgi:hypothetical protein
MHSQPNCSCWRPAIPTLGPYIEAVEAAEALADLLLLVMVLMGKCWRPEVLGPSSYVQCRGKGNATWSRPTAILLSQSLSLALSYLLTAVICVGPDTDVSALPVSHCYIAGGLSAVAIKG